MNAEAVRKLCEAIDRYAICRARVIATDEHNRRAYRLALDDKADAWRRVVAARAMVQP